ncbi:MAG: PIG-L family deacetylase [Hyphomicrobiales bacterium]|nr:PIG-L family deacetylase [Hyphomicrobiales bacterium]
MNGPIVPGGRILLLAPHPDDEVVGCAAAALRAGDAGARVLVLYLTTGLPDMATQPPWRRRGHAGRVNRRSAEAWSAAELLGLRPVAFLRHPSRSLRRHLDPVRAAVARALRDHAVDVLWAPAYEGGHADHDTANAVAATFAGDLPVFEFAAYNNAGGRTNSQSFPVLTGAETVLTLDARERDLKRRALALYRSERRNLSYVQTAREMLRPLAGHDYARRPHPGPLFYERFHWVPFRHPAIDWTTGDEVCADLAAFAPRPPEVGPAGD